MVKHGIPTAAYATFDNEEDAVAYVKAQGAPIVVKEDGLKGRKRCNGCSDIGRKHWML